MYYYNLNLYEHGKLIVDCLTQVDAGNARQAMKYFKNLIGTSPRYIKAIDEIKKDYPSYTMKAERSVYN